MSKRPLWMLMLAAGMYELPILPCVVRIETEPFRPFSRRLRSVILMTPPDESAS